MSFVKLSRHVAVASALFALGGRVLLGCDDDSAVAVADAGPDTATTVDAGALDAGADGEGGVAFRGCPGQFSGVCADIEVPLDWSNPDGKKITVFVDEILTSPNAKKVLWLLQGGPGGSGADMVPIAQQIAAGRDDVDIYTLDHRGVGFSSRLGCPQEPGVFTSDAGPFDDAGYGLSDAAAVVAPCIDSVKQQYGDDLAQYTVSNAARDLKYVIDLTRRPDQDVYVYGVSYGTYWAHRYLQIFPDHPAGVILDSIVPPEGEALSEFDLHGDLAGMKLAELCKQDAVCNEKLGPDPWTRIKSIAALIGTGHCPDLGLTQENRNFLFGYLQFWGYDVYPFAALWRFERCSADDVQVLKTLAKQSALFNPTPGLFSQVLYYNIAFNELWEVPPPSGADQRARFDSAVFPAGEAFDIPQSSWPTYPKDEYWGKYAVTQAPVLMLNGTLDVQTPIETASRMKDHINGPHQTFVTIPNANHGTIISSPTLGVGGMPGSNCGLLVIESFLDNPQGDPDQSCLQHLMPLDFSGIEANNVFFAGTADLYTGLHTGSAGPNPLDPAHRAIPKFRSPFGL